MDVFLKMKVKKRNMQRLPRKHWGNLEKRRFASPIQLQLPDDLIHFMAFSWQSSWLKVTLPSRIRHGVWPLQALHAEFCQDRVKRRRGDKEEYCGHLLHSFSNLGWSTFWIRTPLTETLERVLLWAGATLSHGCPRKDPEGVTRFCKIARCCEITRGNL